MHKLGSEIVLGAIWYKLCTTQILTVLFFLVHSGILLDKNDSGLSLLRITEELMVLSLFTMLPIMVSYTQNPSFKLSLSATEPQRL